MDNLVCEDCGHFFDPSDKRGHNPEYIEGLGMKSWRGPQCPACALEKRKGSEAWAIWNSCQGVFTCSVTHTRKEAQDILNRHYCDDNEVVPVRVFKEREDRVWFREWVEEEREREAKKSA